MTNWLALHIWATLSRETVQCPHCETSELYYEIPKENLEDSLGYIREEGSLKGNSWAYCLLRLTMSYIVVELKYALTQQTSHKDKGRENLEKLLLIQEMLEKSSFESKSTQMSMEEVQALTKDDK